MKKSAIVLATSLALFLLIALWIFQPSPVAIKVGSIHPAIIPIMDKTNWRFTFAAKITNHDSQILILPAFRIFVPNASPPYYETTSTSFVPPGSSYYQFFGGQCPVGTQDRLGKPNVTFLHNDWYVTQEYAKSQISSISRMQIDVKSWEAYDNGASGLQIHFINRSGLAVSSVNGTALFLRDDGSVSDGSMFEMDPGPTGERELDIFDVPNAKQATRCIVQINAFRTPSQQVPTGVPTAPSVQ